jgi:hypothetical protein
VLGLLAVLHRASNHPLRHRRLDPKLSTACALERNPHGEVDVETLEPAARAKVCEQWSDQVSDDDEDDYATFTILCYSDRARLLACQSEEKEILTCPASPPMTLN